MRNQISVLALDLGSNLGWGRCICTLRPELHVNVVEHGTIYLDNLTNERMTKEYNQILSRQRVRATIFEEVIRKLTESAKFDCFVTEDVFCNPTRISAFRSLVIYMEILERIINLERSKRLHTISPKSIKKWISHYGGSDKSQVQAAVLSNKQITMKRAHQATEHEFDMVAAAWSFVQENLMTIG